MSLKNNQVEDLENAKERKKQLMGQPYEHDPNFKGPVRDRSCTDCICLLLYMILGVVSIGLAIFSFAQGNPSLLIYPTDSQGKVCGYNDMKDRPYLVFYDLLQCVKSLPSLIVAGCSTTQQCVASCPSTTWSWLTLESKEQTYGINIQDRKDQLLCVDQVDFNKPNWANYQLTSLVKDGYCAPYLIPEKPVLYRCMPAFLVDTATSVADSTSNWNETVYDADENVVTEAALGATKEVYSALLKIQDYADRVLSDLRASWLHIVVFCAIALVVAFIWIVLLRFAASVIIWITIILFVLLWLFGVVFCFYRYNLLTNLVDYETPDDVSTFTDAMAFRVEFESEEFWLAIGIICLVILLIVIVILIVLGARIRLAIALFEETSRALGYMPSILIWPFIPFVIQLATVTWAVATAFCLATLGRAQFISSTGNSSSTGLITLPESVTSCDYSWAMQSAANLGSSVVNTASETVGSSYSTNSSGSSSTVSSVNSTIAEACRFLKYKSGDYVVPMQIFNVFMFFWNFNFTAGFGILVLSCAFSSYYWAFQKPADIPHLPLIKGIWIAIRYHLGSVAFGSLIIAIVQIIRVILDYIMTKLKKQRNHVGAFLVKCVDCCFSCLERLVKYIARKAYIMVAVHGKNFCASAFAGWQLIMRNAVRALVLSGVSRFLIVISKLIVTGGMAVLAYFYFHGNLPASMPALRDTWPVLTYFYVPVIFVALGSFIIASVCFHVYEVGVETMFLSFLEDCERNDGTQEKPYYMTKRLAAHLS